MNAHELARQLLTLPDAPVVASIYNPNGAPIFGAVDDATTDMGDTVFLSVPSTDADATAEVL